MAVRSVVPALLVVLLSSHAVALARDTGATSAGVAAAPTGAQHGQRAQHIVYNSGLWLFGLGLAVSARRPRASRMGDTPVTCEGRVTRCPGLQ
jgi:hypothetical protein